MEGAHDSTGKCVSDQRVLQTTICHSQEHLREAAIVHLDMLDCTERDASATSNLQMRIKASVWLMHHKRQRAQWLTVALSNCRNLFFFSLNVNYNIICLMWWCNIHPFLHPHIEIWRRVSNYKSLILTRLDVIDISFHFLQSSMRDIQYWTPIVVWNYTIALKDHIIQCIKTSALDVALDYRFIHQHLIT